MLVQLIETYLIALIAACSYGTICVSDKVQAHYPHLALALAHMRDEVDGVKPEDWW